MDNPLPLCRLCAKNRVLCSSCNRGFSEGRITEYDIELSRLVYEMFEGRIGFKKAVDANEHVIVLADRGNVGELIGREGNGLRRMSERVGKPVKIVGVGDVEDMIRDLIAPARIHSINKVYKPGGETAYRVRIDSRDKGRLRINPEAMKSIISSIAEREVDLKLE
ncbi:MAG: hypothetical protein ABIH11_06205 [Candidatus Altiarchaeota archaeon]